MKLIERSTYLEKLRRVIGTADIKVITGVRRSGKSKLLEAFIKDVQDNVKDSNCIHINYNLPEFSALMSADALYGYVEEHRQPDKHNFVLIDEVQMCNDFEKAINWLYSSEKYDIYITGSNAFLLGSDLATLFTGRTFTIEVYPFSFKEYVSYFGTDIAYKTFEEYLAFGGMAGSFVYTLDEDRYNYLTEVYNTLIVRDIKQKYKIKNPQMLDKLSNYLMDNISNLTSAGNIAEIFCKHGEKITNKTVDAYIEHLCRAFAFYKVRRFDIRGKRYLNTNDKYYLCDHAFRYAKLGTKNPDRGRMLENAVAIELMRRGYKIYVGTLYKKEIDFVAVDRKDTVYIQVCDNLNDEETFKREVTPLLQIKDAFPKMIISRTWQPEYLYEGVRIIDASDWFMGTSKHIL